MSIFSKFDRLNDWLFVLNKRQSNWCRLLRKLDSKGRQHSTESDSSYSAQNFWFSFRFSFLTYSSNTTSISVPLSCQHSWRTACTALLSVWKVSLSLQLLLKWSFLMWAAFNLDAVQLEMGFIHRFNCFKTTMIITVEPFFSCHCVVWCRADDSWRDWSLAEASVESFSHSLSV